MTKPKKTSYPVSFRVNFKAEEMAKIRDAAEIKGGPVADIVRDGAFNHARRIVNEAKKPKTE